MGEENYRMARGRHRQYQQYSEVAEDGDRPSQFQYCIWKIDHAQTGV